MAIVARWLPGLLLGLSMFIALQAPADADQLQVRPFRLGVAGVEEAGREAVHPPGPTHGPEDLYGDWVTTNSHGEHLHMRFEPDGRALVLNGHRTITGMYRVDFRRVPAWIDFGIDGYDQFGIIEFLPDGSARLASSNRERPTSFEPGDWEVLTLVRPPQESGDAADLAGSREAVLDMLAVVPDTPVGRAGQPLVSYADYEAIVRAAYDRAMPDLDFGSIDLAAMAPALARVSAGPGEYIQYLRSIAEGMTERLGIGVTDVRRGLTFGRPPEMGLLFGLTPGVDFGPAVAGALDARGFARRDVAGSTVWYRLEDGRMDVQNPDPADPFFGYLGQAARIALLDGVLAGSPYWSVAADMVAAAGDGPSLGDDPVVRAAVEAVTDPDRFQGRLLQLMLFSPADVMVADHSDVVLQALEQGRLDELETLIPEGRSLVMPPYLLAALADRFSGDRDEAVVALVYGDRGTAESAAATLRSRLAAFRPSGGASDTWASELADFDGSFAAHVYQPTDGGLAVAVVTIGTRAILPNRLRSVGGRIFSLLANSYYGRGLSPLTVIE